MSTVEKRQVCKCENCGNEAEMVITCTLPETSEPAAPEAPAKIKAEEKTAHKLKGQATCTHCGNEAEMWIDD
jgi:hypothetical protein